MTDTETHIFTSLYRYNVLIFYLEDPSQPHRRTERKKGRKVDPSVRNHSDVFLISKTPVFYDLVPKIPLH